MNNLLYTATDIRLFNEKHFQHLKQIANFIPFYSDIHSIPIDFG